MRTSIATPFLALVLVASAAAQPAERPKAEAMVKEGIAFLKANGKEALEMVGLKGFEERAPHHLSGGQKKLVAIAGILAMRPEVIVLDEPTAGLDPLSSARILELILKMNRELGITLLLSTHDVDVVPYFAERVFVLHHGKLEADGNPEEIFNNPELLRKAHLRLPRVAEVFEMLQQEGIDTDIQITAEMARDEKREKETVEWVEGTFKDLADETM